jgi:methylmalonyl-CoA mutase
LNEGVIKRKIQESADKEQNFLIQERNLLGTNKYPNKDENETRFRIVSLCKSEIRNLASIIEKRLAEK